MADEVKGDSHLSTGAVSKETPVRQHHRLATGEKVSGQEPTPYGAKAGDTSQRVRPSRY